MAASSLRSFASDLPRWDDAKRGRPDYREVADRLPPQDASPHLASSMVASLGGSPVARAKRSGIEPSIFGQSEFLA